MVIQLHKYSFTQKIFFEFKVFMSSSLVPIYSPSKSESALYFLLLSSILNALQMNWLQKKEEFVRLVVINVFY